VLKDGVVYTAVDVPGSTFTEIYSINTQGEVAGGYGDSDDNEHGFVGVPAH
jgi:uncharacterized membrane protein